MLFARSLVFVLSLCLFIGGRAVYFDFSDKPAGVTDTPGGVAAGDGNRPFADGAVGKVLLPWAEQVQIIPEANINASHAALADLATGEIIASRKADEVIYPASMTKVMTLIVVAENLPNESCLKDTITISNEVYEEMKRQGFGILFTSDCHDKNFLDCNFEEARHMLLECGFTTRWILTDKGFCEVPL